MTSQKAVVTRKISFPPDAVFQSAVQDGDNGELWRVLNTHTDELRIDRPNHVGITALHHCVLNNNLDAVKMLLGFGADVSMADVNGFTPLHTAAACGYLQLASFLLIFGADVFSVTNEGDIPLDLAKDSKMSQLLQRNMIFHIHKRTYLHSWLLYQLKELWRTLICILLLIYTYFQILFRDKIGNWQEQRKLSVIPIERPKGADSGSQKPENCKQD